MILKEYTKNTKNKQYGLLSIKKKSKKWSGILKYFAIKKLQRVPQSPGGVGVCLMHFSYKYISDANITVKKTY